MSDNHRRYDAIKRGLLQFFEKPPQGRQAQYLETLTKMVSGLVGAKNSHLSSMADKVPDNAKRESRIKRFARFVDNEHINHATFFAPFARTLLLNLSHRPLVLAIDGSTVGQGCIALMINLVYRGRALPIGWLVVRGKKGHLSQELHLELLRQIKPLVPLQAEVVLVGDGEFDGTKWLAELEAYHWRFVCRTAKSSWLWLGDEQTSFAGLEVEPDSLIEIGEVVFTKEEYGPVRAIAHWEAEYEEPHYLVTNFELAEEAIWYYKKRFRIETFFSDSKSRGFRIERSHLSDPTRLARLLLVTCLGYLWLVYLGTVAVVEGWDSIIHRTDRCDLSLFSLGFALLEHFLNQTMPLPVAFVPILLE
jgi:hypothetical protein